MRARGATIKEVRDHLKRHGIVRAYAGVQRLLASTLVLGEIRYGGYDGHCPVLVDREIWEAVQRVVIPRGRKAKSQHLLARQSILRCGTCGARLTIQSRSADNSASYRCPPANDSPAG